MFWNVFWDGGYKDGVQHKVPDPGPGWDGSGTQEIWLHVSVSASFP